MGWAPSRTESLLDNDLTNASRAIDLGLLEDSNVCLNEGLAITSSAVMSCS